MVESFHVGIYWLGRGISEKAMVYWCLLKAFWSNSFVSEKKELGTWKSCSFAGIQDNIGLVEESSFKKKEDLFDLYTWLLWFIHLTVDKPYQPLCEYDRHKLGRSRNGTQLLPFCSFQIPNESHNARIAWRRWSLEIPWPRNSQDLEFDGVVWMVGWESFKSFLVFFCVTSFPRSGELNRVNIPKNLGLNLAW